MATYEPNAQRIVKLTNLESEKVHACIMYLVRNFETQYYKKGEDPYVDTNASELLNFYSSLAKKFERI